MSLWTVRTPRLTFRYSRLPWLTGAAASGTETGSAVFCLKQSLAEFASCPTTLKNRIFFYPLIVRLSDGRNFQIWGTLAYGEHFFFFLHSPKELATLHLLAGWDWLVWRWKSYLDSSEMNWNGFSQGKHYELIGPGHGVSQGHSSSPCCV